MNIEIETTEPITIICRDIGCGDDEVLITVDGIDYAIIPHATVEDLDLDIVRVWVEETYYSDDYKSCAFMPSRLSNTNFLKEQKT
jgi:hypothetical protein